MHLRDAAKRVGILNPRVAKAVRLPNLGSRDEGAQAGGRHCLPVVGARGLDLRAERLGRPQEGFHRHRAARLGGFQRPLRRQQRQDAQSGGCLGSVDERETLLGSEFDGREARSSQDLLHSPPLPTHFPVALTQQAQGHMRQGRQVTACANGPEGRDDGVNPVVEHLQQALHELGPAPRVSPCQGICA